MSAARDRIARAINAYVNRRLHPLERDLASTRCELADLRCEVSALGVTNRELLATVIHSLDDEWSRFGMFHLVHDDMLTWAEERPEWSFVFSPHPSLSTRLDAAAPPLTPEAVAGFRERWDALPNTTTFTAAGYGSLFAHSDLMVTDGLSMLLEYQLANKPVVHLKRPDHRPFSTMGRIAQKGFHSVGSVAEARVKADGFAAGQPDPLAQAQREVVQELFGDHRPAKEIVEHIRRNW